jgi:hypothetical protein
MKTKMKVGTLIDSDIMNQLRRRAADEGRSLSDLIQDALAAYLASGALDPGELDTAYQIFCERPFKLNASQFKEILEADAWDQ